MTTRLRFAFMSAGLIGAGLMTAALTADAQQPAPPQPAAAAPAQEGLPGTREHPHFSAADRAAFFDARVAAIHAGLELTPDQEKLWPPVESAMRDFAKFRVAQREAMKSQPKPTDPVQRLETMSERTIARGQTLKKLADAAGPLYATLTPDQKHRLPVLMHGMHHHRGMMRRRLAMMRERGGMGRPDQRGGPEGHMGGHMGGWHDRDRGPMGRDGGGFDAR